MHKNEKWNEEKNTIVHNNSSMMSHIIMERIGNIDPDDYETLKEANDWAVDIKINGIQITTLDASKFLKALYDRSYAKSISKEANKLFEEKWDKTFGPIEDSVAAARDMLSSTFINEWEIDNEA